MNVSVVFGLAVCALVPQTVQGFTCYKCSYTTQTEGSRRDCIEKPEDLGMGARLECNSTSFCVLAEQYDLHQKMVTSYFRTCSGKSWGNDCERDWSHVNCKASCQGNYCNEHDVGKRHEEFLREHKDDGLFNSCVLPTPKAFAIIVFVLLKHCMELC